MSVQPSATGARRPRPTVAAMAVAGVIVFAVGGVFFYRLWVRWRAPIQSVVVLPFTEITPLQGREGFADGVTDEIVDALARVPGLRVMGRTSTVAARSQASDVRQVAAKLGAEALLEGAVQRHAGRVRITVNLNRAADGFRFWSHTFDGPMGEVRAMEQDIAGQIGRRVPAARGWKPVKERHTAGSEAYQAYLEGRAWFDREEPEALRQAIRRFERATQLDPLFARGWAWLSISQAYLVEEDAEPPNAIMPSARDAAERGATLDPDASETHLAMGIVMLQYDRRWEGARQELDRAVELSPGSTLARYWQARWCEAMDHGDDALTALRQAQTLDPLSPRILSDLALVHLHVGQTDRAVDEVEQAAGLNPGPSWVQAMRIAAVYQDGQKEKAARLFEDYRASAGSKGIPALLYGGFTGFEPYLKEVQATLGRVEELRNTRFTPADTFAWMAATAGNKDAFFEWADVAFDERSPHLAYWRMMPGAPVSDPRFRELLQKMNLVPASAP